MKKQVRPARKRKLSPLESFGAFPLIGPFAFASLLDYPNNILIALVPVLIIEGVLVVFFLRRLNKKNQPAPAAPTGVPQPTSAEPKPQPKVKGISVTKAEIVNDTARFLAKKGLFRKRWVTIKEIPIFEITAIESFGNELTVTWKGTTASFVNPKKGESFTQLHEQIKGMIEEHQKALEAKERADKRRSDVTSAINASMGVVDISFDMLMALQTKRVNWTNMETYTSSLGAGFNFTAQTIAPLTLDFSKVSAAVKDQAPKEASQEALGVLKSVYGYFDGLNLEEDLAEAHPNFKDAKAVMLAYYTLNDLLLGKVVGERENKKESQALQTVLQNLAKETHFNVNFDALTDTMNKKGIDIDLETIIEDSRDFFKEQLKNIDLPMEPPPAPPPPTEQAVQAPTVPQPTTQPEPAPPATENTPPAQPEPVPAQPPAPQETVPPIPQEPAPTPTETPAVQEPEAAKPSSEPTPIQPQQPTEPSAPQPMVEEPQPAVEQPQPVQPPPEEPSVEQQPPQQPESAVAVGEGEAEAKPPEPPEKKPLSRRLRKSILGY